MTRFALARCASLVLAFSSFAWAQGAADNVFWMFNQIEGTPLATTVVAYDSKGSRISSFPIAPPAGFVRLAKAPDGRVWVADFNHGVLNSATVTGGAGVPVVVPQIADVAIDVSGSIWTLENPPGAWAAVLRDPTGVPMTVVPLPTDPDWIITDPLGNAWVVDIHAYVMHKVTPTGLVLPPVVIPGGPSTTGTQIRNVQADRQGRIWVLTPAGLRTFDNNGSSLGLIPLTAATELAIDPAGRPRVLVGPTGSLQGTWSILTINPSARTIIGTLPLPMTPGGSFSSFFMDQRGRAWLRDSNNSIVIFDRDGVLEFTSPPLGFGDLAVGGDPTGTGIIMREPFNDGDADGFSNYLEVRAGSDAFDPVSVPPLITLLSSGVLAGQQATFQISSPLEPGFTYLTGASATVGEIPLSFLSPLTVPLSLDALLTYWLSPANLLLTPAGPALLDAFGQATFSIFVPPATSGITFQLAAVTVDPVTGRAGSTTPPRAVSIL